MIKKKYAVTEWPEGKDMALETEQETLDRTMWGTRFG